MSSIALLVALLLGTTIVLTASALVYVTHRHPTIATPLLVGIGGAALIVAYVMPVITRQ
ncbi:MULTISPECIES: hypothetical protein [Streptomyces]|uniref:Uncharacterized protein n=1 Tax=Streptomyces flavovirens TaxID=52258 RepID=A0ABV8N1T6_9ACTN|nr:hypothetical protein [Streptomyces sp. MBT51]MBK3596415.1 hypothetical protein [Streptomyces sp. MBT51]